MPTAYLNPADILPCLTLENCIQDAARVLGMARIREMIGFYSGIENLEERFCQIRRDGKALTEDERIFLYLGESVLGFSQLRTTVPYRVRHDETGITPIRLNPGRRIIIFTLPLGDFLSAYRSLSHASDPGNSLLIIPERFAPFCADGRFPVVFVAPERIFAPIHREGIQGVMGVHLRFLLWLRQLEDFDALEVQYFGFEFSDAILAGLIPAQRRTGFYLSSSGDLVISSEPVYRLFFEDRYQNREHIADYMARLLTVAPVRHPPLAVQSSRATVALNAGATQPARVFSFDSVIRHLHDRGVKLLLLEGPNEKQVNASLRERFPTVPFLTGDESLEGAKNDLGRVDLLITNDTGIMHLADSIGRHCLALVGASSVYQTGPRRPGQLVWQSPIACSPCMIHHKTCVDFPCKDFLDDGEFAAIWETANRLLCNRPEGPPEELFSGRGRFYQVRDIDGFPFPVALHHERLPDGIMVALAWINTRHHGITDSYLERIVHDPLLRSWLRLPEAMASLKDSLFRLLHSGVTTPGDLLAYDVLLQNQRDPTPMPLSLEERQLLKQWEATFERCAKLIGA